MHNFAIIPQFQFSNKLYRSNIVSDGVNADIDPSDRLCSDNSSLNLRYFLSTAASVTETFVAALLESFSSRSVFSRVGRAEYLFRNEQEVCSLLT